MATISNQYDNLLTNLGNIQRETAALLEECLTGSNIRTKYTSIFDNLKKLNSSYEKLVGMNPR